MKRQTIGMIAAGLALVMVPQASAHAQTPGYCTDEVYIDEGLSVGADAELQPAVEQLTERGFDVHVLILRDLDGASSVPDFEREVLLDTCPNLLRLSGGEIQRNEDLFMVIVATEDRQKGAVFGADIRSHYSEGMFSDASNELLGDGQYAAGVTELLKAVDQDFDSGISPWVVAAIAAMLGLIVIVFAIWFTSASSRRRVSYTTRSVTDDLFTPRTWSASSQPARQPRRTTTDSYPDSSPVYPIAHDYSSRPSWWGTSDDRPGSSSGHHSHSSPSHSHHDSGSSHDYGGSSGSSWSSSDSGGGSSSSGGSSDGGGSSGSDF